MAEPSTPTWTFTGRHMLIALLTFFGIVIAANVVMINIALSTHTGVVANEPYRKGLKYNERIEAAERQDALGWSDDIRLEDGGGRLVVVLADSSKGPVRGLKISALLGRPATIAEDETLALEEKEPGRYEAKTVVTEPGNYIATIEATDPAKASDGVVYRARKRLWLKP